MVSVTMSFCLVRLGMLPCAKTMKGGETEGNPNPMSDRPPNRTDSTEHAAPVPARMTGENKGIAMDDYKGFADKSQVGDAVWYLTIVFLASLIAYLMWGIE